MTLVVAPDPISAALADGVKPLVIAVAAHEVGHGIAWADAGFPVGPIRVERGWFGGVSGGYCKHNAGGRVTERNVYGFLIGCAAGFVAQKRCAQLYLGGRHRNSGGCNGPDEFKWVQRTMDRRDRMSWGQAKSRAERLLARHGNRLDALTARLAYSGRLSGV